MIFTDPAGPQQDKLYPSVVAIIEELLKTRTVLTPLDVLVGLEVLDADVIDDWRQGRIPYLERGITQGLARVARLLRCFHARALELGLEPVPGRYTRRGRATLRFSKRGDEESERAYSCHYVQRNRAPGETSRNTR